MTAPRLPTLPWICEMPDLPALRYWRADLFGCALFITPHGWDVYYHSLETPIQERHGKFAGLPLPSVDECKVQAEQAARELMQGLKDSGQFEAWTALWSKP